jgi:cytochrome b
MTQISVNTTNKIKITLDVITFISTLVLLSPPLTGIPVHEWLGLAVIIPLLVHLLLNWQWIVVTTRRFFGKLPGQSRINYGLNWAFFILMTAEGFSGLMISKEVLPLFGLSGSNAFIYRYLHRILADSLLIVLGLHLAMNWKWVLTVLQKIFVAPFRNHRNTTVNTSPSPQPFVKAE